MMDQSYKEKRQNWTKIASFNNIDEAKKFMRNTLGITLSNGKSASKGNIKLYFACHERNRAKCPCKIYLHTGVFGKFVHVYHNELKHSHPDSSTFFFSPTKNDNFDSVKENDPRSSLLDSLLSKYKRKNHKKTETKTKTDYNHDLDVVAVVKEEDQNQSDNIMEVLIDSNEDEYYLLKNSQVTGNQINLEVDENQNCVTYMEQKDSVYAEAFPGVRNASFYQKDNFLTGSLRVAPYTIKPYEMTSDFRFVYWIISGEVTVRSTSTASVNGQDCLFGKKLSAGSCILVPKHTPYTIENRSAQEALLSYVLINEKSSNSLELD